VLGRVRQGLGHHVVRGDLDAFRQPAAHTEVELDPDAGATGQRAQGRAEPAPLQDRGMHAPGDLAQFVDQVGQPLSGARPLLHQVPLLRRHAILRGLELEGE
jgi:hypothetical protein